MLARWIRFAPLVFAACAAAPSRGPDGDPPPPDDMPPPPTPTDPVRYPDPDWATGDPASVGIDPAKLDEASAAAERQDSFCLLVIRHGTLVYERYYNGATVQTTPKSWSIAKSYTSTTAGIAMANGDLPGLDAHLADWLDAWRGDASKAAITVRDVLRMTTGLHWSVFSDYIQMVEFSQDHSDYAQDLDADDAPGTSWTYHNGGVQLMEPLFRAATGASIEAYAQDHLWSKIGTTATWAKDPAGHPTTYANVLATCRDHARLGYLYLHGGKWKSEQVVPAAWVDAALTPSQDDNRGYGLLWWLNGEAPTKTSMNSDKDEMIAPWAPPDMFAARGFGSQFIDVIPSLDLVVVRFGQDPTADMNPTNAADVLMKDATSDVHRSIVEPILAGTR